MRRIHIAIGVADVAASVPEYTRWLGEAPVLVVPGEHALWRTASINLSIRRVSGREAGQLRHLGWEDAACQTFTVETDVKGIAREQFTPEQQAEEIRALWPDVDYLA